jgi:hypothetical protein
MLAEGKVCQVFNSNPQGSRLRGRPQKGWWNSVQTDVNNTKLQIGKRKSKNRFAWEKFIKEAKVRFVP